MVGMVLLLLLLLIASVTDIRRHKIYNWTTYPGIALGVAANALAADGIGLEEALAGFLVCGVIMLLCLVLFDIGGGDVKLVAMMGAFLGVHAGIEAMLWTFVVGSLMGTAILIWQVGAWRIVTKSVEHLGYVLRARSWIPLTDEERQPLKRWLFLAPSAFVAVCIVIIMRNSRV
jgi:prepilin peptidase CpaA